VFEGEYHKSRVAIKVYDFRGSLMAAQQEAVWREAALMESLRSEYLVGFRGLCFDPRYCLVMEYCEGGTLRARLDDKQAVSLPAQLRWAMQISYGVYQLHRVRIIHRDLKAENILLDAQGHAKVADFGLSIMKSGSGSQSKREDKNGVGTLAWMAPELFQGKPQAPSADLYSLGMVLWEIISRQLPFPGVMPAVIAGRVALGHREVIQTSWPLVFKTLITACWEAEPTKRPTAEQVGDECKLALNSLEAFLELDCLREPAPKHRSLSSAVLAVKSGDFERKEIKGNHQPGRQALQEAVDEAIEPVFHPSAAAKESRSFVRLKSCLASACHAKRFALLLFMLAALLIGLFWIFWPLVPGSVTNQSPAPSWRDYNDSVVTGNSSSLFAPSLVASPVALLTQLVTACERGDLSAAKRAILQGAELLTAGLQVKQPLAAAVWAMNLELIDFLIFTAQLKGISLMTWSDCEKHNQLHYGKVFALTVPENFPPLKFGDWVQLLSQMESFPSVSQLHLGICQEVWKTSSMGLINAATSLLRGISQEVISEWRRKWNLSQVSSWEALKAYAHFCASSPPPPKCRTAWAENHQMHYGEVDISLMGYCLGQTRQKLSALQASIQQRIIEAVQAVEKAAVSFRR